MDRDETSPKAARAQSPLVAWGAPAVVAAGGLAWIGFMMSTATEPPQRPIAAAPAVFEERARLAARAPAPAEPTGAAPQEITPAVPPVPAVATGSQRARPSLARGTSGSGALTGPLSAELSMDGPVLGPEWMKKPLPSVQSIGKPVPGSPGATQPAPAGSPLSSELPTAQSLALSRLANPQLEVRPAEPRKNAELSADNGLVLNLVLGKPAAGYRPGETVTVRATANANCYLLLVRVDASGKAGTVFHSPFASRSFACAVRTGSAVGTEYLLALASAQPLSQSEVASALAGTGNGFHAVPASDGGASPSEAWSLAVSQASSSAGGGAAPRKWQRFEWQVATASYAVQAPASTSASTGKPAAGRPTPEKTAARPSGSTPAPAPSTPAPAKDTPKSDPSAVPSVLPGGGTAAPAAPPTPPSTSGEDGN